MLMIGGAILVLVSAGSAVFFLGINKSTPSDKLSLPAEQQQPLTNPPKPVVKTQEVAPAITATTSATLTPKTATPSALEKLKSLQQSSSSASQSSQTR